MITIRRAEFEDIPRIMEFIDTYWKKGHILATNRSFFEWQFADEGMVNLVLAEDKTAQHIYGINGYIRYNQSATPDITGCMWKALKTIEYPMLGLNFGEILYQTTHARYNIGIGLNSRSRQYEKLNGAYVAKMNHAYRLGNSKDFHIADIKDFKNNPYKKTESKLESITSIEQFKKRIPVSLLSSIIPYKDYYYIEHRYFKHPIYNYNLYSLIISGKPIPAVFVVREITALGRKCAKIVDYFGEEKWIGHSGKAIDELISLNNYEFISFYCLGIDNSYLKESGFSFIEENDINIIPCYFEPFEKKNIDIYAVMIPEIKEKTRLFLGDGDQDRPSKIT
ncbi:MAG: hypothetical protein IJ079_02080 [Lachnospiraceae bacterium]|nr:hypothetical protein [Lachnospiraceae bacterium]